MKFDPKKLDALSVRLHGKQIGVITRLVGDRQLFAFEQDYVDDQQRPTLSLSFKGSTGGLVTKFSPVGRRVPVFFSTSCLKATSATISLSARTSIPNANSSFSPSSAPTCLVPWSLRRLKATRSHPNLTTITTTTATTITAAKNRCGFRSPASS